MRTSNEATCEPLAQHSNLSVLARLAKWPFSREQKNSLADLTDEQLRDIGVDPRLTTQSRVAASDRISLLDLYWQQPRPPRRR